MKISDWKPQHKNTLRGTFTLEIFPWLHIRDCLAHQHPFGKRWFAFPAAGYLKDGQIAYKAVIVVPLEPEMKRMQLAVCRLLEEYLPVP